jgi:hypothetical protein
VGLKGVRPLEQIEFVGGSAGENLFGLLASRKPGRT